MPDLFDAMKTRRSIRKYQPKPVPQKVVFEVLETAGWAPSAHNAQPWRFIVLEDAKIRHRLAGAMAEAWAADMEKDGTPIDEKVFTERVQRFESAPVLILACLSLEGTLTYPDQQRQITERDLAVESLGAALQNLLLAAHAKGLGACWFCAPAFCKETVRGVLGIPTWIEPSALVTMGYPVEHPAGPAKKPLIDYCFRDKWGSKL